MLLSNFVVILDPHFSPWVCGAILGMWLVILIHPEVMHSILEFISLAQVPVIGFLNGIVERLLSPSVGQRRAQLVMGLVLVSSSEDCHGQG